MFSTGYYCISFLSFDELLELRHRGSNRAVDTVAGDIYGGKDYSRVYSSPFFNLQVYFFPRSDISMHHVEVPAQDHNSSMLSN
jgi:hypothetical protein